MCYCGDLHCHSCGPAQGNSKCFCGAWADDGCEHLDDDGHLKPEFIAQAEGMDQQERKYWEAYAADMKEMKKLVESDDFKAHMKSEGIDSEKDW